MKLKKEHAARIDPAGAEASSLAAELEQINRQAKTPLRAEDVYLFAVRLCDNRVDRDGECFSRAALEQLAPLFVGKSGIFDHQWSAKNQTARLYRCEVVPEAGVVAESGEGCCSLKGYAYMLRAEQNAALIAEIEAGIKKEVSVSCSVARRVCAICGNEIDDRLHCVHEKGQVYDGVRCVVKLCDPTDAYEWSFVAVPAQRQAGVLKALRLEDLDEATAQALPQGWGETIKTLQEQAACGRRYLKGLQEEVLRLGLLSRADLGRDTLLSILQKLDEGELLAMKKSYTSDLAGRLPLVPQLDYGQADAPETTRDHAFCI